MHRPDAHPAPAGARTRRGRRPRARRRPQTAHPRRRLPPADRGHPGEGDRGMNALAYDGTAMVGRQLRRVRNNPGLAILTQLMPVNMLLFFGYVFGSALAMPGREYRAFLVPGLLAATAAGGVMTGMFQAAQDTHRGVTDRFRALPVSRAAVPLGQAVADLVVTALGTVPLLLVGLAVGWRIEGGPARAAGAVGLLLLFRFACTWVGILLGLLSRSEEAAGQLGASTFFLPLLSN
ncbi:ABC-transporter transmembrane protein, partial [Streptomyces sp. e14]